jgi:hypothetical protein
VDIKLEIAAPEPAGKLRIVHSQHAKDLAFGLHLGLQRAGKASK